MQKVPQLAVETDIMASNIKHTQLTRVGYTYQDLMCIKVLIDWFKEPDKYQWVSIEGAILEGSRLVGLDDVVALNKEGQYELLQVKFTIDAERDSLKFSFDWLLDQETEKSTSLLQKWVKDFKKYSAKGLISSAALKTNRIPDDEVALCLQNEKIDINLIPKKYLEIIQQQINIQDAKEFFDFFLFKHSQQQIDKLEKQLQDSLVPDHTTTEGWLRFRTAVERWATRKDEPNLDGKIRIFDIRDCFTIGISRSLSQFFEVPAGYFPPSEDFHKKFVSSIKTEGCHILSGLPGMGKSTYLSFLTNLLVDQKYPVIRHHYSLSERDINDRISYVDIARSLQIQLKEILPITFVSDEYKSEALNDWILRASNELEKDGKKLIIIIDGLDHVSRERSDISQLEHLLNRLIKLKHKVSLVLGTQPVGDADLPTSVTASIPRNEWHNLPPMDLYAIQNWINELRKNNEISLIERDNYKEQLVEISEALLQISGGYPLHLRYSVKNLSLRNKALTKYDIEKLPICPDGDIRKYYEILWTNLSASAKKILLLITGVDFGWPTKNAISYCFQNSLLFEKAYDEIKHLVEEKRSGISAFHGSISVFIKNKTNFKESFYELLPSIKKWLVEAAPQYWKWGWEWIIESDLGNFSPLIEGITRDWAVNSFCKGYPLQHIEQIISTAENIALEKHMFSALVRLRLIKIRLINGPEFQLQEYSKFLKYAVKNNPEKYSALWMLDNLRIIDEKEISVLPSIFRDTDVLAEEECYQEIIRRLRFYARMEDGSPHDKVNILIRAAIEIITSVANPKVETLIELLSRLRDKEQFFRIIVEKLIKAGNIRVLLEMPKTSVPKKLLGFYANNYVLACYKENIKASDAKEKKLVRSCNLGIAALLLEGKRRTSTTSLIAPHRPSSSESISKDYLHDLFFFSFATQLKEPKAVNNSKNIDHADINSFINKVSETFVYSAYQIAKKISSKHKVSAFELYQYMEVTQIIKVENPSFELSGAYMAVSQALAEISLDLALLLENSTYIETIDKTQITSIKSNSWWNFYNWLDASIAKSINILNKDDLIAEMEHAKTKLVTAQDNTANLANEGLDFAAISFDFSLIKEGKDFLRLAAENTLGYGYRKDVTFSELYDAIDTCSNQGIGNISDWLRRVAPFTNDMFSFTERENRHIPGWYLELLAKHSPERFVDEMNYHMANQNWWLVGLIIEKFIKFFPLNSASEQDLLKSCTTYEALEALKERAKEKSELQDIYNKQIALLGGTPPAPKEYKSSSFSEKKIDFDFDEYSPNRLKELQKRLRDDGVYIARDFMEEWISYWDKKGKGLAIIESFENLNDDDVNIPFDFRGCLDDIFLLSHKLQGATKAYKWAVKSIRENYHWSRYMGERSEEIIKKYAYIYKDKWKKLLIDTMQGTEWKYKQREWINVPTTQLVNFLVAAGQNDLACEITETMLESLENEIKHLPLEPIHWSENPVPIEEIAPRLLLTYYKWPDRFARVRMANIIAGQLEKSATTRKIYLKELNKLNYETDVVDYLSILLLTENNIFSFKELHSAIQYPSILSDDLLQGITNGKGEIQDTRLYYSNIDLEKYTISDRYEKSKDGIPGIYFHFIDKLAQRTGYPLDKHMSAEWDAISNRQKFLYFNPYNFCDEFYLGDRISCSLSSHAENVILSAFLRTLSFAHEKLEVFYGEVLELCSLSAAFGGLCTRLLPSNKPLNWPNITKYDDNSAAPNLIDLNNYLTYIRTSDQILLRANGPIYKEIDGINIDLEVALVQIDGEPPEPEKAYDQMLTNKKSVFAIASNDHPDFIARWEVDWMMRGFFSPQFSTGGMRTVKIGSESIEYLSGKTINATWKYWMHNWTPATYRGTGPSMGTYLVTSQEILKNLGKENLDSLYFLGKLTILDKRNHKTVNNTYFDLKKFA